MAGVLAIGGDAYLSFTAAAALWQIVRGAVVTEVTVPPAIGKMHRDGIRVHRIWLPPEHRAEREGIRVTSLVRTVLDLAMVYRVRALDKAFEQAQVVHKLPPEPVAAEVLCRRGYRGNARLRTVLHGAIDPAKVLSILELRFLRMCDAHGLERPLVNEVLGDWMPDFFWPQYGLVVETDGLDFHRSVAARRRDALKDAALAAMGLTVIRLTWADVVERPEATVQRIRSQMVNDS